MNKFYLEPCQILNMGSSSDLELGKTYLLEFVQIVQTYKFNSALTKNFVLFFNYLINYLNYFLLFMFHSV